MQKRMVQVMARFALIGAALTVLQACSPAYSSTPHDVTGVYESTGIVSVRPYTRTIFSSNNF